MPCETVGSNKFCASQTHSNANHGGPHGQGAALADYDGGKLDGFVAQAQGGTNCGSNPNDPGCSHCNGQNPSGCVDVMQYHDGSDIPNYWKYAQDFVLQDHMFEPNASWSEPQHLYQVSEWSAYCTSPSDPYSCTNQLQSPNSDAANNGITNGHILYAWTDLTWLLHKQNVSWGYYIMTGTEPDCEIDSQKSCTTKTQSYKTAGIWNPLPSFETVNQDGQEGNIQSLTNFYNAAKSGTLPAVSWIDPSGAVSEHPTSLVSAGQTYVTGLINAVMQSPDWNSTAIFVSWDDWGGFYDHVSPPGGLTGRRQRLRIAGAGIVISPYAKQGYLDHQTLSHDAYKKFIEDASSVASASTRRQTAAPTRASASARPIRCWATSATTSTSTRRRGRPSSCRCARQRSSPTRRRAAERGCIALRGGSEAPSDPPPTFCGVHPFHSGAAMSLCFIEPQNAIRVIAESVGREARRQILGEVVRAWVDEIPESELESHYAKAVADLDEHDLSLLAAWHASLEVGHPLPNKEFLVNVFSSLGENRREALKIAAGFRGEEAFEAGVGEEQAFDTVLPWLSEDRCVQLASECLELYCWDRLGVAN